jgi:hypothetical protein
VRLPRFSIASIMAVIGIVAIDFAAIRAMLGYPELGLFVLGVVPMANALAVGILIGQQRPGSRPFLIGFEAFGVMAMALFVAFASTAPVGYGPINSYLALLILPMDKIISPDRPLVYFPIACFVIVVMLAWPQVAFALLGGFLSRRYEITISRR